MIIVTSSLSSNERKFYGIKKDGTPYFGTPPNTPTFISSNSGRVKGECLFINYTKDKDYSNSKEILACIPQKDSKFIEYYALDNNTNFDELPCYDIFENITSYRFSVNQIPYDNNLIYVFSYINNSQLMISQGYFDYSNRKLFKLKSEFKVDDTNGNMISCYFTKNNSYVCFYVQNNEYKYVLFKTPIKNETKVTIIIEKVFESIITKAIDATLNIVGGGAGNSEYLNCFYKAVHLKEEYGAFVYFKNPGKIGQEIKIKINEGSSLLNIQEQRFGNYFSNDISLNDLIKISDEQICFVSSKDEPPEKSLFIIIITINYKENQISTKSFGLCMNDNYNIAFYKQIISNLYNNFIVIAFSHNLDLTTDYGSSFIILGYPRSEDYSFYIIDEINTNQLPIHKLSFNLTKTLNIENNIFDYTLVGTLISNYSDDLELFLDNTKFEKESIIPKDKNITISFQKQDGIYEKNTFKIEFAYVVQESSSEKLKNFTGKYSNFSFIIEKDICCFDENCIIFDENTDDFLIQNDNTFNISFFKDKCNSTKQNNYINHSQIYENESKTHGKDGEISVLTNYISQKTDKIIIKSTNNNFEILNETNSIIEKKNNNCSQDDILSNKCDKEISTEQITQIYSILKDQIKSNKSLIISTERVTFQISSSSNKSSYTPNTEPPKQINNFQISSNNTTNTSNVQPFSISSSQRPKQEFQISSSNQNNAQTNSRPAYVSRRFKQNFEISKQTGAHPASQNLAISGQEKPNQTFQISSSHNNTNVQPSNLSISYASNKPKQQNFQISSSHNNNNNNISPNSTSISFAGNPKPKQTFQISSSNNRPLTSSNSISFSGQEKPKQTFQISSSHNANSSSNNNSISFSGNPKPKQTFQISSSHNQNVSSSNSLTFSGNPKPKQNFQISSQSIKSSSQSMTFEGQPKQQFQISHNNVIQPSSQGMTFEGKKPQFQISHGNSIQQSSQAMTFEGKKQQFEISHGNSIQQSSQAMTFEGKPKQQFQISHGNSIQPSSQSMTFSGTPKPKLEISHGNSIQQSTQGFSFEGTPKPKLEIGHGNSIQQSSQGITFEGQPKPKQVFEISSSHGQSSSQGFTFEGQQRPKQVFEITSSHGQSSQGTQGISFIAERPKLIPSTNSITFEGKDPNEMKKSDPSKYQISSNNGKSNSSIGISFIAPERKPLLAVTNGITFEGLPQNTSSNNNSITFSSQGFSYSAPDPPKELQSVSIKYTEDGKQVIKKKSKHYAMEFDAKYKKCDPKDLKIVNKVNDLFFKAKYEQKLPQRRRAPMSVKAFFTKKGKRRRGRK